MDTTGSAEPLLEDPLLFLAGLPPVEVGSPPDEPEALRRARVKLARAQAKEEWWWIERAKLYYLDNGILTLLEAAKLASQFQRLTHASDSRTLDLAQTLLTSTIDLQYHLIVHRLFSIERAWFLYDANRPHNYRWATKVWADEIKAAETESERIKIWTPTLEKETSAMIEWMQVFSASLRLKSIFPEVVIMEKDEEKKLLRERLQRYFTMKFILTVDMVFVKLVKPILDGELGYDNKTVKNLFNQDAADALAKVNEHPLLKEIIIPCELWPLYSPIDKEKALEMNALIEKSCKRRDRWE